MNFSQIKTSNMTSSAVFLNLTTNFFQFFIRFIIGIWFTRFLIHNLGSELYGLIPLAYSITEYFLLVTLIINAPSGRFLIISRSQKDYIKENLIFNTFFWGICVICIVLIFVSSLISLSAPFFLNIPEGHKIDSVFIFFAVGLVFIATTFRNPFALSTYVTNKLYLRNINDGIENLVKVSIASILIMYFGWKINAVIVGMLASTFIGTIIIFFYWKYLTPELHIKKINFNLPILKEITGMGGWMLISQIGTLLFLQSELFIVNIFYGPKLTGQYGAIIIIPAMLRIVAGMISANLQPPIMDRYSKQDIDGVFRMVVSANRILGIIIGLPLSLICVFSNHLLKIWLGPNFTFLWPILFVMVAHLSINLPVTPLNTLQTMANKVKFPALVTIASGITNVSLALLLGNPNLPFGVIGIPIAGLIVLTFKNAIFTPIYSSIILNIKKRSMFSPVFTSLTAFLIGILLSLIGFNLFKTDNFFNLSIIWIGISLVYLPIMWFILLKDDEKVIISRLLKFGRN